MKRCPQGCSKGRISKFQRENTSLSLRRCCLSGPLAGNPLPLGRAGYATTLRSESCSTGNGTSCLVCPAQTCQPESNLLGWLPGQKAPQGSELMESGNLRACGASSSNLLSLGSKCLPGICSAGWSSRRLLVLVLKGCGY